MIEVNHECYVSFEVAKLLKEAGFDWKCNTKYSISKVHERWYDDCRERMIDFEYEEGELFVPSLFYDRWSVNPEENLISAPTLDVAQRWLREKNLLLYIPPCHIDGKWLWRYWITNCINKEDTTQIYSVKEYDTYEKAQEAGIKKCLEVILENKGK